MNERAFKLDYLLALAAVLLSVVTTAALIYQTSVMRDQYATTVWPYLTVNSNYGADGEKLALENDGFGPALIRSARLTVGNKVLPTWNAYIKILLHDPHVHIAHIVKGSHVTLSFGNVDAATIVRPGAQSTILTFAAPGAHQAVLDHPVTLDFCYCSLNGQCWTLHSRPGRASVTVPIPVHDCAIGDNIESPVEQFTF
jgi:hypothetical protein